MSIGRFPILECRRPDGNGPPRVTGSSVDGDRMEISGASETMLEGVLEVRQVASLHTYNPVSRDMKESRMKNLSIHIFHTGNPTRAW